MQTTNPSTLTLWTIDPVHTSVGFQVRHLMVTNVRGSFSQARGTVRYDASAPEATVLEVQLPTASVWTNEPQRDAHLKSADFFDVERHPTASFRSTQSRPLPGGELEIAGEFTLRGVTRELVFRVTELTSRQRDHRGFTRMGASATARLRRSDFGITYNKMLEAGGIAISDEVQLTLDVSLVEGALP